MNLGTALDAANGFRLQCAPSRSRCDASLHRLEGNPLTSYYLHRASALLLAALIACGGSSNSGNPDGGGTKYLLSISLAGSGSGKVTSTQPGIDCGSTCSASFDQGSSVALTATATSGSEFTGWSGSCSGTGACTVSMDAAKSVTARFRAAKVVFYSQRKLDGTDAANANGTNNIWSVSTDATGLMPLTSVTASMAESYLPQWSPDGAKIAFYSSRKLDGTDAPNLNTTFNIWRLNADGSGLMPLTNATSNGTWSEDPQWSPDSTQVAFVARRNIDGTDSVGVRNVWRVNASGTLLRLITNATSSRIGTFTPQWSPDGTKVVFASNRKLDGTDAVNTNETFNIWRANADGTGLMPLTNATALRAWSESPQWSPDGTKVVFDSNRKLDGSDAANTNNTYNIWQVNADGTGLRLITNATANMASSVVPQWSPDGTKIAFYSARKLDGSDAASPNNTSNIWRVNADGTGLMPLTTTTAVGAHNSSPRWSPDGTKLVFNSQRKLDGTDAPNANLTSNIWRVNADGTGVTPLTTATAVGAYSFGPSFSP